MSTIELEPVMPSDFSLLVAQQEALVGALSPSHRQYLRLCCDTRDDLCLVAREGGRPIAHGLTYVHRERAYLTTLVAEPGPSRIEVLPFLIKATIRAAAASVDSFWVTLVRSNVPALVVGGALRRAGISPRTNLPGTSDDDADADPIWWIDGATLRGMRAGEAMALT